jgi:hypothetical protein
MHIHPLSLSAVLSADTTGYRLLLLGHLLCVIVGFGSTFVYPFLGAQSAKRKGSEGAAISDSVMATAKIVTTPFVYGALVFGLLLVGLGDSYDWGDRFVQVSITLLVVALAFSAFVHVPNLDAMNNLAAELANMGPPPAGATGPPPQAVELETRGKAAARNGGVLHVLFAVVLVLMVWKPL